jgi:hypothetical protein
MQNASGLGPHTHISSPGLQAHTYVQPTWLFLSLSVATFCSSLREASNWARALGREWASPTRSFTASVALQQGVHAGGGGWVQSGG